MLRYFFRRLLALPLTLACIALGGFGLVQLLPGDPVSAREDLSTARRLLPEDVERLRATYGLALPAAFNREAAKESLADGFTQTQLFRWLSRLARLDLGDSHEGRPVATLLAEALPVTLTLGLCALLFAYATALPLGALLAARRGGGLDTAAQRLTMAVLALPAPWVAVGLLSLVGALPTDAWPLRGLASPGAEQWGFLARWLDHAQHLLLPVCCLTYGTAALLVRYQRGAVLEALSAEFVRAARAKGVGERAAIYRHALRASLGPVVSLLAVELPWVLSGSVVVETAFDLPGMGLLVSRALNLRDYPTLLGAVMVLALCAALGALLADLLAAWADPRLREREPR